MGKRKRKNKGYQREYDKRGRKMCIPAGAKETLEQYLHCYDVWSQEEIEATRQEYAEIEKHSDLTGDALVKYCQFWLHKVQIDDNSDIVPIVPLETVIKNLEMEYRRRKSSCAHGSGYFAGYQRRIIHKDNQKFVYNTSGGSNIHKVRIPSLKRSKATWKRFYELFPYYQEYFDELNGKNGVKLKKVW